MYGRALTPAAGAAATLPLTGSPAVGAALLGAGMVFSGLLLVRTARHRRADTSQDDDQA